MPEVQGFEKLFSVIPRKRFGVFNQYGISQFGFSRFGDEDIYFIRGYYGKNIYGQCLFGDVILLSGIYQISKRTGEKKSWRLPYYITKNPRYDPQQAWRAIFAAALVAWQSLTSSQKAIYNKRATGRHFFGNNLFIAEYLRSHYPPFPIGDFLQQQSGFLIRLQSSWRILLN